MKRKAGVLLVAASIGAAFAGGFLISYYQFSHCLHTKTYFHANGKVARRVTYKSKISDFLPNELKHGTETTYDENEAVLETGEWKNGHPWNGRCWIPALGDAGSWAGLGRFKTFKNGIEIEDSK